jgi:hypothetical protein
MIMQQLRKLAEVPTQRSSRCNLLHIILKQFIICFLLVWVGFLGENEQTIAESIQHKQTQENVERSPIHLVLLLENSRLQTGKSVKITVYLENVSRNTYYIGNMLLGLRTLAPFYYIELIITDEKNREIPQAFTSITALSPKISIAEKISRAYVSLGPGMIHGLKVSSLSDLRPGHYKLTAIYREVEAIDWPELEKKSLPYPVWTKPLVSNTVSISVVQPHH